MKPQPFTWEAYWRELYANPHFFLFDKFTFDHMTEAEIDAVQVQMQTQGEYLLSLVDDLGELPNGKTAALLPFPGKGGDAA